MLREAVRRLAEARGRLPAVFWVLWIGTLINRLGGVVGPLLTFYLIEQRQLTQSEAGAVVSLFGAGQVGGSLLGGALADHVGRRATLIISLLGGAVIMIGLGMAESLLAVEVLTALLGLIGEMYRPAVFALVADVVPERDRVHAFGLLYWVINLGFATATILGGLLASISYLALFLVDAVTMAAYGVLVWRRVPETRLPPAAGSAPAVRLTDVFADRLFIAFALLTFLTCLAIFQSSASLSGHLNAQGHSPAIYGAVMAVNGIVIVMFQPDITRRVAKRDVGLVLAAGALLQGVGFFLHGVSSVVMMHALAVAVWTIGEILQSPTASAVVSRLADPTARGRYQGVFTMSWGLASCLGPLLGTQVLERGGPWVLWGGCLGIGVIAAAGFLVWRPAFQRRVHHDGG